jgi:hypothetical protein
MALCGLMPLLADEQITNLANELKANEKSFTFHSDRLKQSSPVGNVLNEDEVSSERQKVLDGFKVVFEDLKKRNKDVKDRISLLQPDQSLSEHPPVANTLSVPVQQHHSRSTQNLIADLLDRAKKFDKAIRGGNGISQFSYRKCSISRSSGKVSGGE